MIDVLVLDDDPTVRLMVAEALRDEGFRVDEAASLHQARLALCTNWCRLLIADHDLGEPDGADGFSFAQAMRQERPGLGVIYMTARMEHLATLLPGELMLRKPFRLAALIEQAQAASPRQVQLETTIVIKPSDMNNY